MARNLVCVVTKDIVPFFLFCDICNQQEIVIFCLVVIFLISIAYINQKLVLITGISHSFLGLQMLETHQCKALCV